MNVDNFLNLEKRTGVKDDDIEDFLRKAGDVEAAIKGLRDGTIDPTEEIKIAGIESPEEIAFTRTLIKRGIWRPMALSI